MSVKWWEEKTGHASSRRIILMLVFLLAAMLAMSGTAMAWLVLLGKASVGGGIWLAVLSSGTGLATAILPIMQWGKTLDTGKGDS